MDRPQRNSFVENVAASFQIHSNHLRTQTHKYFTLMAHKCQRNNRHQHRREWSKKHALSLSEGSVLSGAEEKAAAFLTHGAYSQYVSTAKCRERRWRLLSTFPLSGKTGFVCFSYSLRFLKTIKQRQSICSLTQSL